MDITTLPCAAELSERRRLQIAQVMLKEHVSLKNNQLAAFSNEQLLTELFVRSMNEGEAGRAVESSDDAASDQQFKDVVAVAAKEKKSRDKRGQQDEDKDAAKRKKTTLRPWSSGGFALMVAFGSIMTLIFSLSLIHLSGGFGEGKAPPALPPFGSRSLRLRQSKHQSSNDNTASPETIISPLPASIAVPVPPPPPILSPAAVSNHRMKINKLRSATCFDTPNRKDVDGYGCDDYEEYDWCYSADFFAGDMGPATESSCYCSGGIAPTNSPTISDSPTKSATPSKITCLDTPNWEDRYGDGCDWYEGNNVRANPPGLMIYEYDGGFGAAHGELYSDLCLLADNFKGDMGSATKHCCFCKGKDTNYPNSSSSPTKSATPSSSFRPSSSPLTLISTATNPELFCLDTPSWKDKWGWGCDIYEKLSKTEPGCASTNSRAGYMGPATENCCGCQGGIRTCEDYRSKCLDYFNFYLNVFGIKNVVMSPLCKEAESCSCGDHDVKIITDTDSWGGEYNYTVGLHNECKCDFWTHLCENKGVGEACDYAAEFCCGDYEYDGWGFEYVNSPTCYCDFFNYAQRVFEYALKPKAMNISIEFENPCDFYEKSWVDSVILDKDEWERTSLEAIYNKTNGQNWTMNDGWMSETVDHCQWYGISCSAHGRITRIDLRNNNLAGQFPVYTRNYTYNSGHPTLESNWYDSNTKYGLANLFKLKTIDLAGNKLTGTIDYRPLFNLASLAHFDVSGNQLSGDRGRGEQAQNDEFSNRFYTKYYCIHEFIYIQCRYIQSFVLFVPFLHTHFGTT